MRRVFAFLFALTILGVTASALADVPTEMSVQGRLTNAAGAPVPAGLKNFTFKIWDAAAGGTEIWPAGLGETQVLTTDANGLWNAGVGSVIPLTEAVFQSPVRWLEVTVDDGVNPPEILPRIELRTNPYTYRAATSQQADSLAGNSLGDIADMFVDEPGDTMSGQLLIDYPNQSSPDPGLRVLNINDANAPFGFGFFTFGVAGDAASDGSERKFGSAGIARGAGGQAIGVIGEAHGTGTRNIAIWGYTQAGASGDNYSGLFQGGDFEVSTPATSGTAGVRLPANAIDNTEILDEPGIASQQSGSAPDFTSASLTTMVDLETVTITTPDSGYIQVHGFAYVWVSGAVATDGVIIAQIDETAGGGPVSPHWRAVGDLGRTGTGNTFHMTPFDRVYFKPAGTYTFRIEGQRSSITGATVVNIAHLLLTATYYPSSYGTVATSVESAEAAGFDNVTEYTVSNSDAGLSGGDETHTVRMVDLRELELKVAKAEAEAEQARRELLEAKLGPSSGPLGTGRNPGEEPKQ